MTEIDTTIPTPAHFPVQWRAVDDPQHLWLQDRLHYPDPVTPLEFGLIEGAVDAGLTKAARTYDIPIIIHDRHINSYLYMAIQSEPLSLAQTILLAEQSEAKLHTVMGQLLECWQNEWLPEIQDHLAWWQRYDLSSATLPALLAHFQESETRFQRVWEIHFLLFLPSMVAISQFADLYHDLFPAANELDAYRLLAGFESKTLVSGQALWTLSRQALVCPTVRTLLREKAPADVLPALAQSTEGQAFLEQFNAYLAEHGYRGDKLSLYYPFWVEDPTPVIKTLRDYMSQPTRDLLAERQALAAQRQTEEASIRATLQAYPEAVQSQFDFLLRAAQAGSQLKEDHGYWIDYKASYAMRCVLLAIGERLTALGNLPIADDIFYLTLAEVKAVLTVQIEGQVEGRATGLAYPAQIDERKALAANFANITPPVMLGTLPEGESPTDPVSRMFLKVEGEIPASPPLKHELRGNAGSAGVARGIVKVLRHIKDSAKLQPGDILVAESTAPPWTPFFANIAAIVTNNGGVLSHTAVVAREYGIPAVVGTRVATLHLSDGQLVEVDGTQGIVRIL